MYYREEERKAGRLSETAPPAPAPASYYDQSYYYGHGHQAYYHSRQMEHPRLAGYR
jgi:hypothetical protein